MPKTKRNQDEREAARGIAEDLMRAFAWDTTEQGEDYWSGVYDNLMEIAQGDAL